MIYTLMIVCSLFSMPFLNGSLPSKTYSFDETELSNEKFLAYFNDLTDEHVAYCAWAMKQNIGYCSLLNTNGHDPLEAIIKLYVGLDNLKVREKDRLKSLFEQLFKCGAMFKGDVDNRLTKDDYINSSALMEIAKKYIDTLRPQFPLARGAILRKDIHALETIVKLYPEIVEMLDPVEEVTLLHVAAEQCDLQDADSVQIFAYLVRMGADVEMPDGSGNSVAMLMHKSTHQASELFNTERAALLKRATPGLNLSQSFDQVKKIVTPAYEKVRPYSLYIAGGMCLLGLVWYFTRSSPHEMHTQTNHTIELQKVT